MFGSDALKFSVTFLVGFVFLANFLSKIKEWADTWFPTKRRHTLEGRLAQTRIIACWKRGTLLKLLRRNYYGDDDHHQSGSEDDSDEELKHLMKYEDEAKTVDPLVLQERIDEMKSLLTKEQQEQLEETTTEDEPSEGNPFS